MKQTRSRSPPICHPLVSCAGCSYIAIAVVLIAVVVIGLTQAGGGENLGDGTDFDLPGAKQRLATRARPADRPARAGQQLIGGGKDAFEAAPRRAQGHAVVINKWASWCAPCQAEFPVFQSPSAPSTARRSRSSASTAHDKDPAATKFLAKRPLPFPSYTDPTRTVARKRSRRRRTSR